MRAYNSYLTTPTLVSQQIPKSDPTSNQWSNYQSLVARYCLAYSKIVEQEIGRIFTPYTETKTYYFDETVRDEQLVRARNGYRLYLSADLLSLATLTWDGTILTSSQYRLGIRPDEYPYRYILADNTVATISRDFDDAITLAGIWGVHDHADSQFSDVTSLNTGSQLSDSATSVIVTSVSNLAAYDYIRVDTELMHITAISGNTLTVERGVRGYTATTHENGAIVEKWHVVPDVQELVTRLVAYHYEKRNDLSDSIQVLGTSVVIEKFSDDLKSVKDKRRWLNFEVA